MPALDEDQLEGHHREVAPEGDGGVEGQGAVLAVGDVGLAELLRHHLPAFTQP